MGTTTDQGERTARVTTNDVLEQLHDQEQAHLTDDQITALTTAVNNPDASVKRVVESTGVVRCTLTNVLHNLDVGLYIDDEEKAAGRLDKGSDEFLSHTIKKRAVLDFFGRFKNADNALTRKQASREIREMLGPSVSITYLSNIPDWQQAIEDRSEWYDEHYPDISRRVQPVREDARSLREKLTDAGISSLPNRNLALPENDRDLSQMAAGEPRQDQRGPKPDHPGGGGTHSGNSAAAPASSAGEPQGSDGSETPETADSAETVDIDRGGRRYKGPETGIDISGGPVTSYLGSGSDSDPDGFEETMEQLLDDYGDYGEAAYERDFDIDDVDDLVEELRVLRMLISAQGARIKALKDTLAEANVSVSVEYEFETGGEQ